MTASPATRREGALDLAVKVTPKAGRSRVDGVVVDAAGSAWLAVRLAAAPERGRANAALRELIAECLGVAASAVDLTAGAGSRWKRLRIAGDPDRLQRRLEAHLGTDPAA